MACDPNVDLDVVVVGDVDFDGDGDGDLDVDTWPTCQRGPVNGHLHDAVAVNVHDHVADHVKVNAA